MKKLIIVIMVCSLLVFASCKSAKKSKTATSSTVTTSTSVQQLQSQIGDLSSQISAFNSIVSKLQAQIKTTATTTTATTPSTLPTAPIDDQVSSEINTVKTNIKNLTDSVNTLQGQVQTLQDSLKGAATNIGISSTTVNGLSVTFISNNIDVGLTGSSTPNSAQFAIKITNTTSSTVSNLDIIGTINSLQYISGNMASGYPQLIDAAGLCTFAYSNGASSTIGGSNMVSFEAYGGSKASLSIPVGGSITLRPKISILALANYQLPATTFIIALNAITYDATK